MGSETNNSGMTVLSYPQTVASLCVSIVVATTEKKRAKKLVGRIEHLVCMAVTGSFRTNPTVALEVMLNLLPLDVLSSHMERQELLL